MRLLLISNSYSYGRDYLDHCADAIKRILSDIKDVLFIPYAVHDYGNYELLASKRFSQLDKNLISIHKARNPKKVVENARAIFVGGGNTFRLLYKLYDKDLLEVIREKVFENVPYIGGSAGINIASPTIKTTNDMPIVYPPSLKALNLIPFQLNPHYFDPDPNQKIMIESRETRIKEFLEENDLAVLGLREGAYLVVEDDIAIIKGEKGAKLFIRGEGTKELAPNTDISFLLKRGNKI